MMGHIENKIELWDKAIIKYSNNLAVPFSRFAIFLIYFWFGALKVFSTSPANPVVAALLSQTLPFISFDTFIVLFGLFEMIIGIVFVIPHLERLAIPLLIIHLFTTMMPLFLLPVVTWQGFLVPTLEGQYIIKNILIVALAIGISAHLQALKIHREKLKNA